MKKILLSVLLLSLLLGTGIKLFYDKYNTLTDEIASLRSKNQALEDNNRHTKEQMENYRNALIEKKLKKAKLKLAQASVNTIIPLGGSSLNALLTANDIRDYCQEVKEFKALEASISGSSDPELSEDEKHLCAYDIQKELLHALDKYPKDSEKWIKDQYKKIEDKAKEKMDKWF
ncbi:MAG: hypothetical protein COB07_03515 [Sulfurovum sp.]|nr:MAG: hypothetical protein COB07_03515 [Sulfurovum sp.]